MVIGELGMRLTSCGVMKGRESIVAVVVVVMVCGPAKSHLRIAS